MAIDAPSPCDKGIRDRVFGGYMVATMLMDILVEIDGFDIDILNKLLSRCTSLSKNATW